MPPLTELGNWVARVTTKMSLLTELRDANIFNSNGVVLFSPALARSGYAGWGRENEINSEGVVSGWRRIGCNAFSVDDLVGAVSQGRRSSPVRLGPPTLG